MWGEMQLRLHPYPLPGRGLGRTRARRETPTHANHEWALRHRSPDPVSVGDQEPPCPENMHAELDIAPEAAIGRVRTEKVLPIQPAGPPDTSTFPGAKRRITMHAHGATPGVNASAVDPSHHLHVRPAPRAGMSACRRREHQSCSYDGNGSPQDQPSEQKSHRVPQATSADHPFPQGRTAETTRTCRRAARGASFPQTRADPSLRDGRA